MRGEGGEAVMDAAGNGQCTINCNQRGNCLIRHYCSKAHSWCACRSRKSFSQYAPWDLRHLTEGSS